MLDRNGYKNPITKSDEGKDGGRLINGDSERKETTPLVRDSKISEEDSPLWIGEPRDLRENSNFHITQILIQSVSQGLV